MAERVGFEPTLRCRRPLFESGTINHSDTSPRFANEYYTISGQVSAGKSRGFDLKDRAPWFVPRGSSAAA